MSDLIRSRKEINAIDKEMAVLFEKRMNAAKAVAEYKRSAGVQIEDSGRENELIHNNCEYIKDAEILPYYIDFIKNNINISKAYQHRLLNGTQIAISGTKGAFADITAKKVFPDSDNIAFADFHSAYSSVEKGKTDLAFLPIENSFGGDVGAVLDLAFFGNLYINGIYETDIIQNLIGLKDAKIEDVKTVYSHPQALLQCNDFLRKNNINCIESLNTTAAAKTVVEQNDPSVAAIGSVEAAQNFGLAVIKSHINESNQNTTRFAVFSKVINENNENDNRFILMFTVKNTAGALSKAISVIGDYNYNLLDLKSRPAKLENFKHYFYVEGEGNIYSDGGKEMVEKIVKYCDNFKIVGSFEKEIRV